MKHAKKLVITGLVLLGVVTAFTLLTFNQRQKTPDAQPRTEAPMVTESAQVDSNSSAMNPEGPGRLVDYEASKLQDSAFRQHILFFHASWCPECRAYEKAIISDVIPSGTQILKVDYDNSADLKKRYGVTLQSTFVAIDKDGDLVKKWVGYGKEKSVTTILTALYGN